VKTLYDANREVYSLLRYGVKVKPEAGEDSDVDEVLPRMLTDVTIEYATHKTILDCKFYREALVTRDNRHRLHSSHLYQLTAYLQNKSRQEGWEDVRGILLYPAVNHHLDLQFELLGHPVEIRSIDLDQPWQAIHNRLLSIVGVGVERLSDLGGC